MSEYYDREGRSMTLEEYARKFEQDGYKIVEKTEVADSEVSTVWLGLDHSFGDNGPPLIFETLVFSGRMGETMWRYPTEDAARTGHNEMVRWVRHEHDEFNNVTHNPHARDALDALRDLVTAHAQKFSLEPTDVLTALYREVIGDE